MEKIISLTKRRGFIFPSSEIYGGLSSAWDYGPLGVQLKNNLQAFWWREMTQLRSDIVGIDSAILMHPQVWEASGHIDNFTDLMVEDTVTNERYRYDHLTENERIHNRSPKGNKLSEPRQFNLMFQTHVGPVQDTRSVIYLRPETAQGIYVNYKNILQTSRLKLPFGIAQVGKAFRNEIVTKSFIFRTCEFEQMEMQFFVEPKEDEQWFAYWKDKRMNYYRKLGIRSDYLRMHPHAKEELAHYAKAAFDIQYQFPFGWGELEGIHNRSNYDLQQHECFSHKDMRYINDEGVRFYPYIIETSVGLTRMLLMVLLDAYEEENEEDRTVLRLHPHVAPYTIGVFPLVKKDGLRILAENLARELRNEFHVFYDHSGAIGRRYRRQDEIGTPYCITVDYQTKEDNTVTIRLRDNMEQKRIPIVAIADEIKRLNGEYQRF